MINIDTHDRDADEERLEQIVEEFTDRLNAGDSPKMEEYEIDHPDLAPVLRDLLASLEALNRDASRAGESGTSGTRPKPLAVDLVGDYRIVREIGHGGMAIVYEAKHEILRRRVALKVLTSHSGKNLQQRFQREARSVAKLHHTHIVPVHEYGEFGGVQYMAMQYIEGRSLDKVLREHPIERGRMISSAGSSVSESASRREKDGSEFVVDSDRGGLTDPQQAKLSSDSPSLLCNSSAGQIHLDSLRNSSKKYYRGVARIIADVADALSYAHRQRVLHRDIKPSNLLLGESGTIWVTDFGLAKTEDEDLTRTGDIVGTVRYMPPERFGGQCDARSDVYSLGATLYELLTLRPVFDSSDRMQLIRDIAHRDPIRPRTIDPSIPADLETIVLKTLAKEPSQRYHSAHGLEKDLRRFLDDKPIAARRAHRPSTSGGGAAATHRSAPQFRCCCSASCLVSWASIGSGGVPNGTLPRRSNCANRPSVNLAEANHQKMVATSNAEEATRQHRRAEQNLAKAHNAVEDFTNIVDRYASENSEHMQLHRDVLAKALQYYEQLLEQQQPDERRDEGLAKTYAHVARLRMEVGSADLALADYQQACDLYQQLVSKRPLDIDLRNSMLQSQISLAYTQAGLGHHEDGAATLRDTIAIMEPLVQQRSDDLQLESMLSRAYHNLGYIYTVQNRPTESTHYLSLATEIHERLAGDNPDLSLVKLYISVAYSYLLTGDGNRALATYQKSLAISKQLSARFPGNRSFQDYVAWCHNKIGDAFRSLLRFEDAEENYRIAIAMHEQLVRDEPAIKLYRSHLANGYANLGDCYRNLQRYTDGIDAYEKQTTQLQELLSRAPGESLLRVMLKNASHRTALCLEGDGQPELARQHWREAIKYLSEADDRSDDGSEHIFKELQKSYVNLAQFEIRMGEVENAEAVIRERLKHAGHDSESLLDCAIQFRDLAAAVPEHRSAWPDQQQQAKIEQCLLQGRTALQQAMAAGFMDDIRIKQKPFPESVRKFAKVQTLLRSLDPDCVPC